MSELVDPGCFVELSQPERLEQLYLAYGGTECFVGRGRLDQLRLLADQIGIDWCIFTETDFWRGWLNLLDSEACAEPSLLSLQGAVYALLYAQAGDSSLVSPACFYGLPADLREQAIFAASGGEGPTTPPLLLTASIGGSGNTMTLVFDEGVIADSGDNADFSFDASLNVLSATYASGSGTSTLVYNLSRTVLLAETVTLSYTQPGGGVHDVFGNDLVSISNFLVSNGSTQTPSLFYAGTTAETKDAGNPKIVRGGVGEIDHFACREAEILYARGRYWCFYDAWPDITSCTICIANTALCSNTSAAFLAATWTKRGEVIPKTLTPGTWGYGATAAAGTYYDSDTDELHVFVTAAKTSNALYVGPLAITYYKAAAAADWTNAASFVIQDSGNAVLEGGAAWEGTQGVYAPYIKRLNGVYTMFYSSSNGDGNGPNYKQGVATASALAGPWTKDPASPILDYAEEPCVVQLDSGVLLNIADTASRGTYGGSAYSTQNPTGRTGWIRYGNIFRVSQVGTWDAHTMGPFSAIHLLGDEILLAYSGNGGGPDNRDIGFATIVAGSAAHYWIAADDSDSFNGIYSNPFGVTVKAGNSPVGFRFPQDTGGDVIAQAVLASSVVAAVYLEGRITLRSANTTDGDPAQNCYLFDFGFGSADSGIQIFHKNGATYTPLSSLINPGDITQGASYLVRASAVGSALKAAVQRVSDSKWLTPGGTWQVSEIEAIEIMDTAIDNTKTGLGVSFYSSAAGGQIAFTNFVGA